MLLLRVLATTASLSVCDECSCQFFFAKQLLFNESCSFSGSSLQALQTQSWTSSFRKCVAITHFLHYSNKSRFVLLNCVSANVVHVSRSLQSCFDALQCLQPNRCPHVLPNVLYSVLVRVYCCAFLGTPFEHLATRFNCMWPDWHSSCQTFDRFRDVCTILRQIRTSHSSTPEQRCLSWIGLFSITFDSVALNVTFGV